MNKKIIKRVLITFAFIFVFVVSLNFAIAYALVEHGTGDECFSMDIDYNGFPVTSVTVDGYEWEPEGDHRYYGDENIHTIVVIAGKKGDDFPWISTPGGSGDYTTYTALPNPDDNPEEVGDEYVLTLVLNNKPYEEGTCNSFGISLAAGPFPVYPQMNATADITITISGDELEYHYVANKPDEADVSRFKFGINSDHSDNLVPFTFGNANYTHNSNPAPNNVSSVTTKQPIPYEYIYEDTGYVSFCVNGGAADEYTKIEINGVDYANQAPHTQVEVYEHLQGRASRFCIENVPYNAESYNVVVEGRRLTDDKTVTGFGWNYKKDTESSYDENERSIFAHGRLEFVQVKYTDIDGVQHVFNSALEYNAARYHGTGEIYEWQDGVKNYTDLRDALGEALVPYGAELTVRIVPDPGYQLVAITNTPDGFTATDEVGVYKIVVNKDNLYGTKGFGLGAKFAKTTNQVTSNVDGLKGGSITTSFDNGTGKLELNNPGTISEEREDSFEEAIEGMGYNVDNYLDMSLYNSIYKGGKKDDGNNYMSWDTEVEELDNPATVTLNLDKALDGNSVVIIHEVHDGDVITDYELIDATYNDKNKTITFQTDSFSTYAIASKPLYKPVASISANANALTISWESQTGITYEIYRSNYSNKSFSLLKKLEGNTYTNTGLTYGKTYYYKVRACDGSKCTAFSNVVYKKVIPNTVENFTAPAVSVAAIKLSWDKVAVTGYQIQRKNGSKWVTIKTITKNSTLSFVNTKLSANKVYSYRIRAYKTVGRTKVYGAWTTLTAKTTPAKPAGKLYMRNYQEVGIVIGKVSGATHYVVEKSLDGVTYEVLEDLPGPGTLADGNLDTGTKYYYRIKACTEELCSPWTSGYIVASTVTPTFALKTSSKKVAVTVTPVEGATGYVVYRSTKKNSGYKRVGTLTTAEDVYTLMNSTKKGTTYYYKVRAYVELESETVYSALSSYKKIRSK